MALYGTYRPKDFSSLVGQKTIKTTLSQASLQDRISHAYLFCGSRGTGKTSSARILAKAINCQNKKSSGDPCNECSFCKAADNGSLTDLIEIDAASNRGIGEMQELREKIVFSPNFGKAKVYIIDEVHMLTTPAFNALLKTLEEPPAHAYFILATTEFHKVPETIRSRCQTFFFQKISTPEIVERLKEVCDAENFLYDQEGLQVIAERANGGMRDALSILEQSASFGKISKENLFESLGIISPTLLWEFLEALQEKNGAKALEVIAAVQNEGRNMDSFAKDFVGFLREQFFVSMTQKLPNLAWILEIVSFFETARKEVRFAEIPSLPMEIAIAKALLMGNHNVLVANASVAKPVFEISTAKKTEHIPEKISEHIAIHPEKILEKNEMPPEKVEISSSSAEKTVVEAAKKSDFTVMNLETLQKNWKEMTAKMPASSKIFLQKATLVRFENSILTLAVESAFEQENLSKNAEKIEAELSAFLDQKIGVRFEQKTVSAEEFAAFFV